MIHSTTSGTILVVDDDRPLRELIEVILVRAGYDVLTAENGKHAIQVARDAERIDLLLTDLEMPVMGGSELASRFAAFHPATPVLFMTGSHQRVETLDPFTFLAKAFTTDELRGAVRRALKMGQLPAEGSFAA